MGEKLSKNIIIKDNLFKVGDILLVKSMMRKTDTVKILDILFNINTERFVFRVKSLEISEYYYITHDDIVGQFNLLKGVELNDFK